MLHKHTYLNLCFRREAPAVAPYVLSLRSNTYAMLTPSGINILRRGKEWSS
jgi:hypothetical protein